MEEVDLAAKGGQHPGAVAGALVERSAERSSGAASAANRVLGHQQPRTPSGGGSQFLAT